MTTDLSREAYAARIAADWLTMYEQWENGEAYSPSAHDLACVAIDHYPIGDSSADTLADTIFEMLCSGVTLTRIAYTILPDTLPSVQPPVPFLTA